MCLQGWTHRRGKVLAFWLKLGGNYSFPTWSFLKLIFLCISKLLLQTSPKGFWTVWPKTGIARILLLLPVCCAYMSHHREKKYQNRVTQQRPDLFWFIASGCDPCLAGSVLFLCLWRGTGEWWKGMMEQGCLFHTKGMLRVSGHPCPLQRHSFNHPGSHLLIVLFPMNSIGKPTDEENTLTIQSHLHKFTSWGPNW